MGSNHLGPWRDDPRSIGVLMSLWFEERLSSTDAAEKMMELYPGYNISRNSVIAKLHREAEGVNKSVGRLVIDLAEGGSQRPGRPNSTKAPRMFRSPLTDKQREWAGKPKTSAMPSVSSEAEIEERFATASLGVEETHRKTLVELRPGDCRWPCGDPGKADFFFCGGAAIAGLPYCAGHARVAYQRAAPRGRSPGNAAYTPRFRDAAVTG